jgi:hypothetical protein
MSAVQVAKVLADSERTRQHLNCNEDYKAAASCRAMVSICGVKEI